MLPEAVWGRFDREAYIRVFDTWCLGRPEIADFSRLGGPGGRETPVGHEAPYFLEEIFRPPGPSRPPKSTISGRPKSRVLKPKCNACGSNKGPKLSAPLVRTTGWVGGVGWGGVVLGWGVGWVDG